MSERLSVAVAEMAGRLAEFLSGAFPQPENSLVQNQAFLRGAAEQARRSAPAPEENSPLDRLISKLHLEQSDIDLLLLAGMPEEHEGYAAVFRSLHPRGESRPTLGLAAQLLASGSRGEFIQRFGSARTWRSGAVQARGDVPFFEKSIEPAALLWPALHGGGEWPAQLPRVQDSPASHGLAEWLETLAVARATRALAEALPCTVLVIADSVETAFHRAMTIVKAAGREVVGFSSTETADAESLRTLKIHALVRGVVPVFRLAAADGAPSANTANFDDYPDGVVICGRTGATSVRGRRPLVGVLVERLTPSARRTMWSDTIPQLKDSASLLAARYPIEPAAAAEVAADLEIVEQLDSGAPTHEDVAGAIRARAAAHLSGGVKLIRPAVTWNDLVLPRKQREQLESAINRLDLQARVLDEWGFLKGRSGARGVRMLFCGAPGTGKTLSAEVLASALNVDLLFVDISRVVSKWIGETEKNLAAVFDAAETARAVLFFDEADALFGRRTEISDAHDRYANLETAYLLTRLESYEGLAILSSNLRQNIDPAFIRRLDFIIEFDDPDREERSRLWRCHVPDVELLGDDVNLDELATLYPVVGAFIRNAALAAAFMAAGDGDKIRKHHFIRAIRREYEKTGKAFPGLPAGMKHC